jgi:hypothetical protein
VHAVARASHEVPPLVSYGQPDYPTWAKQIAARSETLSALELQWLLADNSAYLDAYEMAFPGAGVALEDRIHARIAELEEAEIPSTTTQL